MGRATRGSLRTRPARVTRRACTATNPASPRRCRSRPTEQKRTRSDDMATIETVLGPISDSQLGFTLSHEHVVTSAGEDSKHYPWMFDWEKTRERAIASLRDAKANGV